MRHRRHACASQGKEIKSGNQGGNQQSGAIRNQGIRGHITWEISGISGIRGHMGIRGIRGHIT